MSKEILIAKKLLVQSEVVDACSMAVKDAEFFPKENVWEISGPKWDRMNNALVELGKIEMEIAQYDIDNG
jgi:hypothetical protein